MNKWLRGIMLVMIIGLLLGFSQTRALAAEEPAPAVVEEAKDQTTGIKAIAAAVAIGVVAAAGAVALALSISKSAESIARQPEAAGQIRTSLMLGLVFIETAIIYALIVAILIVFVL